MARRRRQWDRRRPRRARCSFETKSFNKTETSETKKRNEDERNNNNSGGWPVTGWGPDDADDSDEEDEEHRNFLDSLDLRLKT